MQLRSFLLFSFAGLLANSLTAQIQFSAGSAWKYLPGNQAQSIPSVWNQPEFNPTTWALGNAPFRYGDGSGGTDLSSMQYTYSTLYLVTDLNATNLSKLESVDFFVNYDDGFVLYVNGHETFSLNAPSNPTYSSLATANHESGAFEKITLSIAESNLKEGTNRIAVIGFNTNLSSSDFYFDLSASANIALPETKTELFPVFSRKGGYELSAFDLTLTSPTDTLNIVYTIDGSNPQTSATARNGGQSVTLNVNPDSIVNRANTPGYIVRASLAQNGLKAAKPRTETYIFMPRVFKQKYPGYNWPNYDINGQRIDLEMDSVITTDNRYKYLLDEAMLQIPTISVVTDMEDLFDPATGIYVNALNHGEEWERFCSIQLIDSNADSVFNVNAGLRIRGGWSRHNEYPKHAFRLFFREEYGASKLKYPLFEDEGVDQFDKFDLRCAQNYSWNNSQGHAVYTREVFSRDAQGEMGQPYTRSRYYHLFLNGMYWGLYQTQERSESNFAADYMGDKSEDYDVIKVAGDYSYSIEATDGNTTGWQEVYSKCNAGFTKNEQYFALEGRDANGNPKANSEVMVDIDNLIDYMNLIFYTGNFDAPTTAFSDDSNPNNFYAIDNRTDKSKGFQFFCHDAEHALLYDAISPGNGINTNRVTLPNMSINGFSGFHPQWLHQQLTKNAEYRQRFADRAYELLTGNGLLTPEKNMARFQKRIDQISFAIIAESARWGDASGWNRYTKDNDWLPEINTLKTKYFPARTNIVIAQLKTAGLFPTLNAPVLKINSTDVAYSTQTLDFPATLNVTNPNANGVIYITLNGTDPRSVGGGINSSAIELKEANLPITGASCIKARIYNSGKWSAPVYMNVLGTVADYSNLRVTELNYHPTDSIIGTDTINDKDFEFIELKNVGTSAIQLGGMHIDSAINYTFPADAILAPGAFWVVASKPSWFYNRYGMVASGNYKNNLANSGEWVRILAPDSTPVLAFRYSDEAPWPIAADGEGNSLHAKEENPSGDPASWSYWKPSRQLGGSPFRDDAFTIGVYDMADEHAQVKIFPNPTEGLVTIMLTHEFPVDLKVYDTQGKLRHAGIYTSGTPLDLNALVQQNGLYLFVIQTEGSVVTQRVIYQGQ